ncbi:hypothetical protein HW115_03735 [Verrucomicrobiaceae bacterium N1E253]|uniref:Uncharacterized protein n=1 Tax=Oceaniferula marina TaxID=2748318 RepID=A0A851GHV0_9BACT|nr:hypothetical protein [Oceaniferula marina]NWK54707.1 hypothetical protein [Oceaniferula marina]
MPDASIERIIEENKDSYYRALRIAQTSFQTTPDWNAWIVFFLRTLSKQCEVLARKVEDRRMHEGKQEVRIYDYVDDDAPMFASMFRKRLKGYSSMGYEIYDPEQEPLDLK